MVDILFWYTDYQEQIHISHLYYSLYFDCNLLQCKQQVDFLEVLVDKHKLVCDNLPHKVLWNHTVYLSMDQHIPEICKLCQVDNLYQLDIQLNWKRKKINIYSIDP